MPVDFTQVGDKLMDGLFWEGDSMEVTLADLLALAMSGWALMQTSRFRGSEILLAAIKERAEIGEMLRALDGASSELHDGWRALFAAKKMFESGARLEREQLAAKLQARIDEIHRDFSSVARPSGWRARNRAELILPMLLELRARISSVAAAVEAERLELREAKRAFQNHSR